MTKILICDDHPIVSSGLSELLSEKPDYQIVGVVDAAREIGPAIHRLGPDLMFLDVNMGGDNMIENISGFRSIRPRMFIIIFSSYNLPSLVTRAFMEGADAYILKSSAQAEILDACNTVINAQKFIGTEVNIRKPDRQRIISGTPQPLDKFEALNHLTEKEQVIFHLVAEGKTESEIAVQLYISKHTVHTHRKNLMAKLGLHSSSDFVRFWMEFGR